MAEDTKDLAQITKQSVQSRARGEIPGGFTGVLNYLAGGTYRIAPWWSPQRDSDLDQFWKDCNHLAGTISMLTSKVVSIPIRVIPRDPSLKSHQKQAEELTISLNEESEFGQGLASTMSKWLQDWFCADNGPMLEIIGGGKPDGPIKGPALGIAHLDSMRCMRTGDPKFPILYYAPDGSRYKLYHSRVAFTADMPSARDEMLGVGFCSVSRTSAVAQNLLDLTTYKMEKMGSRPKRGILVGKGISVEAIVNALQIAEDQMDDRGLSIFAQLAILADLDPDAVVEILDLISLPDGFDEETTTRLAMFAISLGFNVPIRWIWPAATSGATKADAMYQHIAGLGGGIGKVLKVFGTLLGGDPRGPKHGIGKFLPPHLKLDIDFQDDEQDRMRAEIAGKRADVRSKDLESGVTDVRASRQQALEAGDINQAQFDRMELEDGRMPSGIPLLSLFSNAKEPFLSWLDLGVPNPLATSQNDPIDMLAEINTAAINMQDVMANSGNVNTLNLAAQALAALGQLKGMYAPMAQQAVQRDVFARLGIGRPSGEEAPPEEGEEAPSEEAPEEEASEEEMPARAEETARGTEAMPEETKRISEAGGGSAGGTAPSGGFDFGVSVGEIIGGRLARGAGGQFINVQDMMEQIRAGMISRMGSAEQGGIMKNSATAKKAANRAALAEKLGIDPALLDGLADMKTGDASPEIEARLAEAGLAEVNEDGSITMTGPGRSMLAAGNSGDVDKGEKARADAAKKKQEKEKPKGKGGGGGGGKGGKTSKSPEQRAQEAKEKREKQEAENRGKVANAMDDEDAAMVGDLHSFAQGNDLPPEKANALAQAGLAEYDDRGELRMTSAGRKFLAAANKGDTRTAKDTLSHARDNVTKTEDTIKNMLTDLETLTNTANELDGAIAKAEAEYAEAAAKPGADQGKLEGMRKAIENARGRAEQFRAYAREMTSRIMKMRRRIGQRSAQWQYPGVEEKKALRPEEGKWRVARALSDAAEALRRVVVRRRQ
jgi:hypothetical protein